MICRTKNHLLSFLKLSIHKYPNTQINFLLPTNPSSRRLLFLLLVNHSNKRIDHHNKCQNLFLWKNCRISTWATFHLYSQIHLNFSKWFIILNIPKPKDILFSQQLVAQFCRHFLFRISCPHGCIKGLSFIRYNLSQWHQHQLRFHVLMRSPNDWLFVHKYWKVKLSLIQ